jgi:hypothetical protein
MNNYPEHDKLAEIDSAQKQTVQDFIDWLCDKSNLVICDFDENSFDGYYEYDGVYPQTRLSREQIMAEYFGIDLQKLSSEKDRILDDWREKQGL